jgi:hypothetical protein
MIFRVTLTNPTLGTLILTKQPKGISDIAPTIKRGENHGLTTEIDVKLEFFCNGAGKEFIDQVLLNDGIDGEVLIDIDAFCGCVPDVEAPDYSEDYSDDYGSIISGGCDEDFEEFYLGQLELQTWTTDGVFTKVNIKPRGILETVKNRLDTKVDLFAEETLDGTAIDPWTYGADHEITMHSKEIVFKSNVIMDSGEYAEVPGLFMSLGITDNLFCEMPLELSDYDELGVNVMTSDFLSYNGSGTPEAIYTNDGDESVDITVTYNFVGNISELSALGRAYGLRIKYKVDNTFYGTGSTTIQAYSPFVGGGGVENIQAVNISGSFGITVTSGKSFYLFAEFEGYNTGGIFNPTPLVIFDFSTAEVILSQASVTDDTTTKAFAVFEAGAQIARVITDQDDSFRSNIFGRTNSEPYSYDENGCGSFTALTNGFMVRGYPTTGDNARTIRMSMNDFFKGLNPIWNLGMGIEKINDIYYIVVDSKDYFYDVDTVIMTINNIPDFKRSEAPEYYYSQINAGYELWETEFTAGLDEFNTKRQFNTGIKAVGNNLELISPLVAAGYRIERARRNRFSDAFSEDSEDDEDNYIICLSRDSYGYGVDPFLNEAEKDENFVTDGVTNVNSPETAYNLRISPMRNILRHSNIINAGLTKYPAREIKFTSGEGNYKMTSEFEDDDCPGRWNNNEIAENENFEWDDANNSDSTPIWLPEIIEFQYPLTLTQWKTIEANPKGVFNVSDSTTDHIKGFILELKYKPGDVSDFKLLRAYV